MRNQALLNLIGAAIPAPKATAFATVANYVGGWEGWLQAEIAHALVTNHATTTVTREVAYPNAGGFGGAYLRNDGTATGNLAHAARADFYIHRPALFGAADESYVELKCISPATGLGNAWNRFTADVGKIVTLQGANNNLVCTALLATYGVFNAAHVQGHAATLGWCWAGNKTAYVLDFGFGRPVTTLANVAVGNPARLFIVAVSV